MKKLISSNQASAFKDLLQRAKKIALVIHVNPDGDAVGSSIALAHCLRAVKPGLEVVLVSPNRYPDFLKWMNGTENIFIFKDNRKIAKQAIITSDVLICLDFNALARLEDLGEFIQSISIPRILIDHHIEPKIEDFVLSISKINVSSTSEIVFRLMQALMKNPIPLAAAEAIMAGIMTDTNMFRNSCSTPDTFSVISQLLQIGVDKDKVATLIFDNFSGHRMKLLGYALSEKLVILPDCHAAYIALSHEELDRFSFQPGDTEGFVNYPLHIKDVNISAYISEQTEGTVRFSFRSRGDFSVNEFARRHFSGGGHKNAAGGRMDATLDVAIAEYVNQLKNYKDEIWASL